MNSADIEMKVAFLDQFLFVLRPQRDFPFFVVIVAPTPVGFRHFPISARHRMAIAVCVVAAELIFEFVWYFFQFLSRISLEKQRLIQVR